MLLSSLQNQGLQEGGGCGTRAHSSSHPILLPRVSLAGMLISPPFSFTEQKETGLEAVRTVIKLCDLKCCESLCIETNEKNWTT